MNNAYTEKLSRMIKMETVSAPVEADLSKFYAFRQLMRELFPAIFSAAEEEDFDGHMLLRWKGSDSSKLPVMFMNHYDVVPAKGEWEHEPFCGEVFDGNIWGRGTLDTKSGLFGMLEAADELASAGFVPSRDVYFISPRDEETTGSGAERIVKVLKERGIRFEMCFDEGNMVEPNPLGCAEGMYALIAVGEKASAYLKFIARSDGGHSATPPKGTSLARLGQFMADIENSDPFVTEITPLVMEALRRMSPNMAPELRDMMSEPEKHIDEIKAVLPSVSPILFALCKTTIAFTMAGGSDSKNALPKEAYVVGNVRFSHHEGRDASIAKLKTAADKYGIDIEIMDPGYPSSIAAHDCKAFKLCEEATEKFFPGIEGILPYAMTGPTDSRFLDPVCDQCIRYRPVFVNKQQAGTRHAPDENISVETLEPCVDFFKYLIQKV